MTEQPPLKLMARAPEDITVFSALLQDALVASADIRFIRDENSFVFSLFNQTDVRTCLCMTLHTWHL